MPGRILAKSEKEKKFQESVGKTQSRKKEEPGGYNQTGKKGKGGNRGVPIEASRGLVHKITAEKQRTKGVWVCQSKNKRGTTCFAQTVSKVFGGRKGKKSSRGGGFYSKEKEKPIPRAERASGGNVKMTNKKWSLWKRDFNQIGGAEIEKRKTGEGKGKKRISLGRDRRRVLVAKLRKFYWAGKTEPKGGSR